MGDSKKKINYEDGKLENFNCVFGFDGDIFHHKRCGVIIFYRSWIEYCKDDVLLLS